MRVTPGPDDNRRRRPHLIIELEARLPYQVYSVAVRPPVITLSQLEQSSASLSPLVKYLYCVSRRTRHITVLIHPLMGEQRPGQAGILVGNGHGSDVFVAPLHELVEPDIRAG